MNHPHIVMIVLEYCRFSLEIYVLNKRTERLYKRFYKRHIDGFRECATCIDILTDHDIRDFALFMRFRRGSRKPSLEDFIYFKNMRDRSRVFH